ncbi:hypothetical protein NDU88_002947 [Pleurodeles waltl]|uniref:Uncharacterized protein n=1 Tax=Pleurodeles waltl TaxID=8319 RepID=A0AAV7KU88_PLEWA|nr:hypothetical protein NDU88_002947 [Pleurodeles waltl]
MGTGLAGGTGGRRLVGSPRSPPGSQHRALQRRPRPGRLHAILLPRQWIGEPLYMRGLRISLQRIRGPPGPHSMGPPGPHDFKRLPLEPHPVTGTLGRSLTGRWAVFLSPRGQGKSESRGARAQQAARAHLLFRVHSSGPSSADHRQVNPARPCLHTDGLDVAAITGDRILADFRWALSGALCSGVRSGSHLSHAPVEELLMSVLIGMAAEEGDDSHSLAPLVGLRTEL